MSKWNRKSDISSNTLTLWLTIESRRRCRLPPLHLSPPWPLLAPQLPLSGQAKFATQSNKLVPGLYQSAYSAASNAVFVTSAGASARTSATSVMDSAEVPEGRLPASVHSTSVVQVQPSPETVTSWR